ncbi:hypothetical protein PGT21_032657 [Puccinia graminis f. sp. tritici]|uniref:Uncharacterized protein n=1 Tax=Puccinia graminis f. sp. tritici TaxID=56615 RepID=A0A5B0QC90_PUCGR|nr:hypothetical protein PGT21_032657 [Puccinia graminis f. sp. tritici]
MLLPQLLLTFPAKISIGYAAFYPIRSNPIASVLAGQRPPAFKGLQSCRRKETVAFHPIFGLELGHDGWKLWSACMLKLFCFVFVSKIHFRQLGRKDPLGWKVLVRFLRLEDPEPFV